MKGLQAGVLKPACRLSVGILGWGRGAYHCQLSQHGQGFIRRPSSRRKF
jgi:hypothetical protein